MFSLSKLFVLCNLLSQILFLAAVNLLTCVYDGVEKTPSDIFYKRFQVRVLKFF